MAVDLTIIRFKLQREMKYLSSLIFRMKYIPVPGLGTFGVDDKGRMLYDPNVPWSPDEQVTALYHEMNHVLRGHHKRLGDRDPKAWNVAADCEIDDDLPHGWPKRPEWMYPSTFGLPDGLLAEEYYAHVAVMAHVRQDATSEDPGSGPCTQGGCDSKDHAPQPAKGKPGVVHTPVPQCFQPSEAGDEVDDGQGGGGISEVEMESIRHHIAKEIEKEKGRGSIPSGLERWAQELLHPKVPWSKLLKTAVRRSAIVVAGYGEKTYAKPRRREVPPYILPKQIAHQPVVAIYVDTSGSMSERDLATAFTEIKGAVRTSAAALNVTSVDAKVYDTIKVSSPSDLKKIKFKGGGGTDMRLCFNHVKGLRPKTNLIVVITDGYTPWPDEPPVGMQTVVVLTQAESEGSVPKWAKVVVIDDD